MNPLLPLTKGSNCMPSQKEGPIWGHNVVKTALCKQVSKSVSLLAQGHKICSSLWITLIVLWETQSQSSLLPTSEGCFQARKEVVLKPWSITDVNLPEVTYHSTGTGHFSLKPSFFLTPENLTFSHFFKIHWKKIQWKRIYDLQTMKCLFHYHHCWFFAHQSYQYFLTSFWKLTIAPVMRVVEIHVNHQLHFFNWKINSIFKVREDSSIMNFKHEMAFG